MTESNDFNFDAFLAGAGLAEASVDIYQKPNVLGRYQEWMREYKRVKALEEVQERSAGEEDPVALAEAEGEQILRELEESKTTWFVRALTAEDEQAVRETHVLPENPRKPYLESAPKLVSNPTAAQAEAFIVAHRMWSERRSQHDAEQDGRPEVQAYEKQAEEIRRSRQAERLHRAFVRIERNGEVISTTPPTVEQILQFPARLGELQTSKLLDAIKTASEFEPEVVSGDFLLRTLSSDQDF